MKTYGGKWIGLFVLALLLLSACSQEQPGKEAVTSQANAWKPLGGALDVVTKNNAVHPKLLIDRSGKLVVVWAEDNGVWNLQAKRWNGSGWEQLASKSNLLYNNAGVLPFDVVIDSTNALVLSQRTEAGQVTLYRSGSSSWTSLASFKGLVQLQSDANGQVHVVFQDQTNGSNTVKRWNGSSWSTVATLQKKACSDCSFYVMADSFVLQPDGKPFLQAANLIGYGSLFYAWNGSSWSETQRGRYVFDYALNANNQLITATSFYSSGTELEVTGTTQDAGLTDKPVALTTRNNQPLLLYIPRGQKLTAKLWNGSAWQKLGSALERDSSKIANQSDVLVSKSGSIFVVWQEAKCEASATCGGGNIHVSQYIQ